MKNKGSLSKIIFKVVLILMILASLVGLAFIGVFLKARHDVLEYCEKEEGDWRYIQFSICFSSEEGVVIAFLLEKEKTNWQKILLWKSGNLQKGVDYKSLPYIRGLTRLHKLDLRGVQIKEKDLESLKKLVELSVLLLGDTRIRDLGLRYLNGLTNLSYLSLWRTRITDEGLKHLKGLSNLSYLSLWETQITDIGLKYLKGLTKLSYLNLGNTQVTDAGVEELQKSLPNCKIYR